MTLDPPLNLLNFCFHLHNFSGKSSYCHPTRVLWSKEKVTKVLIELKILSPYVTWSLIKLYEATPLIRARHTHERQALCSVFRLVFTWSPWQSEEGLQCVDEVAKYEQVNDLPQFPQMARQGENLYSSNFMWRMHLDLKGLQCRSPGSKPSPPSFL